MAKQATKTRQRNTKSVSARKPDLYRYYDALKKLGIPRLEVEIAVRGLMSPFHLLIEEEFKSGQNADSRAEKLAVSMTASLLKRHHVRDYDRKASEFVRLLNIGFIFDEMRKKFREWQKIPYDPGLDNETQSEIVSRVINQIESFGKQLADDEKRLYEWLVDSIWREDRLKRGTLSNYWLKSWYWLLEYALEEIGWKLCKHRLVDEEKFAFWKDWSSHFLSKLEVVKVEAKRRRLKLQPSSIPDPKIGEPFLSSPYHEKPTNFDYIPRKGTAWMKPEWQEDIYSCLTIERDDIDRKIQCKWKGLSSERKYHSQNEGHTHFKHIFPARLSFVPHYRIYCSQRCGLKIVPACQAKKLDLSRCPQCKAEFISPPTYWDPNIYGSRVCHDCVTLFNLNKYSWSSQGFFCLECLEKRENKQKQQRRRSRTP